MKDPFVIAIAGGSGSGKTTVIDEIKSSHHDQKIAVVSLDNYYYDLAHLNLKTRKSKNFDDPQAIEVDLIVEHIKDLKHRKTIHTPVYDFKTHTRMPETTPVYPVDIIIVDGIFSLYYQQLSALADLKVFIDVDQDIRFIRRLKRDIQHRGRSLEEVTEQYLTSVKPMHDNYVQPTKAKADLIVNWNTRNEKMILYLSRLILGI